MKTVATILVCLVGLLHFGFLWLEMVLWQTPTGREIFGLSPEQAQITAQLAMNQGFYNGILGAGLIWFGLRRQWEPVMFLLLGVIGAGIFGALMVKPTILAVQAVPGLIALVTVAMARAGK